MACSRLFIAVYNDREAEVRARIEAGADVNKAMDDDEGVTPLYIAAEHDHEVIVLVLIDAGADKDKTFNNGMDPSTDALYITVENEHEAVVLALLNAGCYIFDELYCAVERGKETLVRMLITAMWRWCELL